MATSTPADELARREFCAHIHACFNLRAPLVLLAQQARLYPLSFDMGLSGGREGPSGCDEHNCVEWEEALKLSTTFLENALHDVYPPFQEGSELGVLSSSAGRRHKGQY